ncbi:MAG: hypothetical protein KF685_08565 [Acidobacteria bacterium]|nr:hypothetical protein [Acidobacteriota bacterium]
MLSFRKIRTIPVILSAVLFAAGAAFGYSYEDDDIPDVTDRVARISDLTGDVQIKRSDSDEWEKAVMNLPIVEGDEIAAGPGARYEIQLASHKHVRISERSYLRITLINDEGIALSLSEGMMALRLLEFDQEKEFFEIDLPKATVAIQKTGRYRLDAGGGEFAGVSISVSEEGEARVYSTTSGFTLRDGRTARVFTDGRNEGEWELGDFAGLNDEFDSWSLDRERMVEQLLANSQYDEYYDRDIYGAEDLGNYGDWMHTVDYGYVWRPSSRATRSYSDWSPYRYGQWRWLPAFGWTWVNDEPWGWATYHHGRWLWHNGYWVWSPYGYYRSTRSWWRPALVVMTVYNNNVCWYPLPYNRRYYNYNRRHQEGRRRGERRPRPATPQPTPDTTGQRRPDNRVPPLDRGPVRGMISTPKERFGRDRGSMTRLPDATAREVAGNETVIANSPPLLPTRREIGDTVSKEIRPERPIVTRPVDQSKTGAASRTENAPLDKRLRDSRMYGNRPPLETSPVPQTQTPAEGNPVPSRPRTGVVGRPEAGKTRPEVTRETPPIVAAPLPNTSEPQQPRRDTTTRPQTEQKSAPSANRPNQSPPLVTPRSETPRPSQPTTRPQPQAPKETPPASRPTAPSRPSTPPTQRTAPSQPAPSKESRPAQPAPQQRPSAPSKPSSPPQQKSAPSSGSSKSSDSSRPAPTREKKPE